MNSSILRVFGARSLAKICDPVVVADAVDVVELIFRPLSVHVQPRETVSQMKAPAYPDMAISITANTTSYIANLDAIICTDVVSKNACLRVV